MRTVEHAASNFGAKSNENRCLDLLKLGCPADLIQSVERRNAALTAELRNTPAVADEPWQVEARARLTELSADELFEQDVLRLKRAAAVTL